MRKQVKEHREKWFSGNEKFFELHYAVNLMEEMEATIIELQKLIKKGVEKNKTIRELKRIKRMCSTIQVMCLNIAWREGWKDREDRVGIGPE